jgi:NADH:ubiquinone oxidoreductase subunit K
MTLFHILFLSYLIFSIGLFGVLSRRHVVGILIGIELMFNAANLAIVGIAWAMGLLTGQIIALFGIAITAAEIAVGLALFLLAERLSKTVYADKIDLMKG